MIFGLQHISRFGALVQHLRLQCQRFAFRGTLYTRARKLTQNGASAVCCGRMHYATSTSHGLHPSSTPVPWLMLVQWTIIKMLAPELNLTHDHHDNIAKCAFFPRGTRISKSRMWWVLRQERPANEQKVEATNSVSELEVWRSDRSILRMVVVDVLDRQR